MVRKKYITVLVLVMLCAMLLTGCKWLLEPKLPEDTRVSKIGTYNIENYAEVLEEFPYDGNVGPIANAQEAIDKGIPVLKEVFGEEEVAESAPYNAYYDVYSNTWLVTTSLPQGGPLSDGTYLIVLGGVDHIIINAADGDVLAVWGTK